LNPDFRVNPDLDLDVCWVPAKILWIHYLVGISQFAKYRENRPVTMTNAKSPKIPYSAVLAKVEE